METKIGILMSLIGASAALVSPSEQGQIFGASVVGRAAYGQSCEMDVSGLVVMDSIGGTTPLAAVDFSGAATGTSPITPAVGGTISFFGSASIVTP